MSITPSWPTPRAASSEGEPVQHSSNSRQRTRPTRGYGRSRLALAMNKHAAWPPACPAVAGLLRYGEFLITARRPAEAPTARAASRYRSLRWRCRSGYSARRPPITRQRSLILLAVRDAGAGWSWPYRYGGASRVRKSIVPPGCWAGGPGASALREGGRTGSPDECTIRACGSAVTGPAASAGLTRFVPSAIASRRRRRRNAPSRVPPSPPVCVPGRERDGCQRCRAAG